MAAPQRTMGRSWPLTLINGPKGQLLISLHSQRIRMFYKTAPTITNWYLSPSQVSELLAIKVVEMISQIKMIRAIRCDHVIRITLVCKKMEWVLNPYLFSMEKMCASKEIPVSTTILWYLRETMKGNVKARTSADHRPSRIRIIVWVTISAPPTR